MIKYDFLQKTNIKYSGNLPNKKPNITINMTKQSMFEEKIITSKNLLIPKKKG